MALFQIVHLAPPNKKGAGNPGKIARPHIIVIQELHPVRHPGPHHQNDSRSPQKILEHPAATRMIQLA